MTNQQGQPDSLKGVSTEFAVLEKAFNTWDIEKSNSPQAIFSARRYASDTLVLSFYCTPDDHPAVGAPEAWSKAFEATMRGKKQQVATLVGEGLCCANAADGRIKGIIFSAIAALSETRPRRTADAVYVDWGLEKLRWLWRQAFADIPYPVIRTTDLPSAMFFDEQCRAEFPTSKADEWLRLLFNESSEIRDQGMAAFLQTEDRKWLQTIFRVLWREPELRVIDTAVEVIAHFNAQDDAATYFVKRLADDYAITDRFRNDGPIARDINILRRLGTAAVPALLQGVEHTKGPETSDLCDLLVASGDSRVKPALTALVEAPTTAVWVRRLITPALDKLNGKSP